MTNDYSKVGRYVSLFFAVALAEDALHHVSHGDLASTGRWLMHTHDGVLEQVNEALD